jgi:spore maturation protein CgeB
MKILLAYPGPVHSNFDVAAGYHRALAALGHEVVAFEYHKYISFYQGAFTHWQQQNPEFRATAADIMKSAAERLLVETVAAEPDLLLIVTGLSLPAATFAQVCRMGVPVVVLLTESPYQDAEQLDLLKYPAVKLALTNERTSVARLEKHSGVKTRYLPHAFEPERHRPHKVGPEFVSDVFFHGTVWPEREALLQAALALPCHARISGYRPDRPMDPASVITNADMARFYSGAKIALNIHRHSQDAELVPESIGPRAYEIAACGAFQLADARAELLDLFGPSVPVFDGPADLRDKIVYYLAHDDERVTLAARARARVVGCTFAARAQKILVPALLEALGRPVNAGDSRLHSK